MRTICYIFLLLISFSACEKDTIIKDVVEPEHIPLDEIVDFLPFEQFNNNSTAIFRNAKGKKIKFGLSIREKIVDRFFDNKIYTANKVTFVYSTEFNFTIPNLIIEASVEQIPDIGQTEIIKCGSSISNVILQILNLTIIPDRNYENTVLNKEFSWMGESFTDVYSNILIEENDISPITMFYNASMGIIGFRDNENITWILDGFE